MRFYKYLAGFGLALALVACGGGGGSAGTSVATTPTPGGVVVTTATDFIFSLDKSVIFNSGSDFATLTVTALDSSRSTVANVPVAIAVDGTAVLSNVSGVNTDSTGNVTAKIGIGGDKSDRIISASITIGGVTKIASVTVTGSKLTVTPVPATPAPGQQVILNISAVDHSGTPIPNVQVTLSGTAGASGVVTTDSTGGAFKTFTAPSSDNSYTVIVSGLNVSSTELISVITPGTGTIPVVPVGINVSAVSLTPQPTSIGTVGSAISRSKLSAKFLTTGNLGIQYMRVRFELVAPLLGNGELISTGGTTVYTGADGVAEADYVAGTRSSPTNGVLLRACYSKVDFTSAIDCPNEVTANLTVAGSPLSISIGDDNTLAKGLGGIAYVKQFLIQVNDSAGVAVKDALVSASVDITHYGKSANWGNLYTPTLPNIKDVYSDFPLYVASLTAVPANPQKWVGTLQTMSTPPAVGQEIWCMNEDWNRNGSVDGPASNPLTNEDINGNGGLEPRKAEIVVSYVSGNKSDQNGQLLIQISYPQNMGRWLAYTLRATTSVAGSEGDASRSFVTDVLEADVKNGSFLTPPFGSGACDRPN
jgi:hypothetical protein